MSSDQVPTSYAQVHHTLRIQRGRAAEHRCPCGAQAEEWSYDHTDTNEITGVHCASVVVWSLDLTRYQPLCITCHRLRDRVHRSAA